jgi:steroid delta-isomerase-like uncharacterized protein
MAEQNSMRIAREVIDAWNAHDPEHLLKLFDEKYVAESDTLPTPINSAAGVREFMRIYITAFPDLRFTIDQMLAEGDSVVTRWTAAGTQRGVLMGIPPTNRATVTRGCTIAQCKAGKVVHDWIYWDTGNLLRQLGVLPGPQ